MIARSWSARATRERAPAYAEHLERHVLPTTRAVEGYAGTLLLQREEGDEVAIVVVTLWDSLEAIHGFAGADAEAAVVADEAAVLLTAFDRRVRHYEVVARDGV